MHSIQSGTIRSSPVSTQNRSRYRCECPYLANGLKGLGFSVLPSQGTYFLNVDLAPMGVNDDVAFCQKLVAEHGVAAIPVSAFYAEDPVRTIMRLCFAKKRETLDAALERLSHVKPA
jgi:N-succinyldiaminopimelate aminotransferase